MDQQTADFSLKTRSKMGMGFLFTLVGGPMLYAAYLSYNAQELFFAILMVILFLTWAIVILIAVGFKIRITESSLHRQGLFSPNIMEFSDVKAIHFGSTWSNFYVESEDKKIYFGKDFENYDQLLKKIVDKVSDVKNIAEIRFLGDKENIEKFTAEFSTDDLIT